MKWVADRAIRLAVVLLMVAAYFLVATQGRVLTFWHP